jgi:hypothetical protein
VHASSSAGESQLTMSMHESSAARAKPLIFWALSCTLARLGSLARRRRSSTSWIMPMGCRLTTRWWRMEGASLRSSA